MTSDQPTRARLMNEEERLENAKDTLIKALTRYPVASKTTMQSIVQVGDYLGVTINRCLEEPDEAANGKPYLSIVPSYRGLTTRGPRFYLTRYDSVLHPLFQPKPVKKLTGMRAKERQRILDAMDRFPILNPTLMQAALGPSAAKYFKPDLEYLIEEETITIWHPDLLDQSLVDATNRIIHDNVTHRGVRYFLTEHTRLLQPFLKK